ncbi:MAG: hypothetical protein EOP54_14115 [Sphingobacteriales bacterium]|nr:MAG: hypothetical protein EOP54_14115 [Sphingobacteriales bacterium]
MLFQCSNTITYSSFYAIIGSFEKADSFIVIYLSLEDQAAKYPGSLEQYKHKYGFATNTVWGKKWKGLFYAIIYGLAAKSIFFFALSGTTLMPASGITTLSFLFLLPFVMGLIIGWHQVALKAGISMSLLAVSGLFGLCILLQQEGALYALIALPAYILMATTGSIAGRYLFSRKKYRLVLLAFILAPFLIAPVERYSGVRKAVYAQQTTITINASEHSVWKHIVKVEAIKETGNKDALFRLAGLPQPVKAAFDSVAVGGMRKAFFDRGLIFTEKITAVIPGQSLAFTIKADPGSNPMTNLEKRLIIEGKYFEVLKGRYEIEKINNQQIKLHLTATYQLSTHFNFYCGWWAGLIMDRIQKSILQIVKESSETAHQRH